MKLKRKIKNKKSLRNEPLTLLHLGDFSEFYIEAIFALPIKSILNWYITV